MAVITRGVSRSVHDFESESSRCTDFDYSPIASPRLASSSHAALHEVIDNAWARRQKKASIFSFGSVPSAPIPAPFGRGLFQVMVAHPATVAMSTPGINSAVFNGTMASHLPPLPAYTVTPMPDLLPGLISDFWLTIIAPHVTYWTISLVFHLIDVYDVFPQYRLHTPQEIAQRNLASRWQVARDVVLEQVIQMMTAAVLSLTEPAQMTGMEEHDVAVWATRIRLAQGVLPTVLGLLGLNAAAISKSMAASYPLLAGALAGGHYPFLTTRLDTTTSVPTFATWELALAKAIYWLIIPGFQFWIAVVFMDSWQYFWHRAMHVNKWMYTHWHARHHRLYVPYAYGALYNHPVEGFVLDTAGAGLAYKLSRMSPRMSLFFYVASTAKTVDDHCGYALPWDPLQHVTSNNAAYHDIHHQSWGIKANFSQPFFTVWDRWLGTMWKGDTALKYERTKASARLKSEMKAAELKAQ